MAVQGHGNVVQVTRVERPRPPNSVSLSLDGTEDEVLSNYLCCQDHLRSWNMELAIVRENNVSVAFTTPTESTFYFAMNYDKRCLVFVIKGRNGWLRGHYAVIHIDGYQTVKGIYEFKSMQKELYIYHDRCRRLPFGGNHSEISERVADTPIGLYALRDSFNTIWAYDGDIQPKNFNKAFGVIVVHTCESMKLQPVFDRICEAFVNSSVRKLAEKGGMSITNLITKWTKLSCHAMRAIEDPDYENEFPDISSEQDKLSHLRVLNVDAYYGGPFNHDVATNPRRWELLEPGTDVPSAVDIPFLENYTDDKHEGNDRDQENGGQSGGKQKSKGRGKGRHHGESKGKRGGNGGGKGQQGGGVRQRGGVSLSAAGFPLIGGWSGGSGKELSMGNATKGSGLHVRANV